MTRSDARALPREYPPAEHVLRDLRLWSEAGAEPPCAGLPVTPALYGATGACSAGALAVLVDAVAGGAALRAAPERAAPGAAGADWIATSDMRLAWLAPVRGGELVARAQALRSGRSNVVLEVEVEAGGAPAAHAIVAFSRLEAQGEFQQRPRGERLGRVAFGGEGAGFAVPWRDRLGVTVRDAARGAADGAAGGALELPLGPYVGNSLGGLQGGIAVALLDFAAESAGRALLGRRAAVRDLAVHFLAIARTGPLRTQAWLLRRDGDSALLRVESRDAGAGERLCALASAALGAFGA
jgi:acyl-coenzyme A thioesterase PaaI-like protein